METVDQDPPAAAAPATTTPLLSRPKPDKVDGPAYQISQEHCYSKLGPFRSSPSAGFFPTEILFPALASDDTEYGANQEGDSEDKEEEEEEEEKGEEADDGYVDVVGVGPPTSLPYDESKVGLIMMECVKHLNLVKVPPENSDLLLEKVLLECGFQQRRLLSTLLRILQGDHLARLTCQQVCRPLPPPLSIYWPHETLPPSLPPSLPLCLPLSPSLVQAAHEPIKRRLHNDRAVRQFRKALSDVNWVSQ